ncbi:ribonuclease H-like protein [Nemania sp. FL0916]|nr:ribonuclease H-like protein [Nemania sp. FL0916]
MRLLNYTTAGQLARMQNTKYLSSQTLSAFTYRKARSTYTTGIDKSPPITQQDSPCESTVAPSESPSLEKHLERSGGLLDTRESVSSLIDSLIGLPVSPPSIYVDMEGVNLCRFGTLSILQVHIRPLSQTYLVDITKLGKEAFGIKGSQTTDTLRSILESKSIPKVFFDVRRDSDALFAHFRIRLQGIHDLQLMELATRNYRKSRVAGLRQCIAQDLKLKHHVRTAWEKAKEAGTKLFAPERGGTYEVFDQRPLPGAIRAYCLQDVHYLPRLWDLYTAKRAYKHWKRKVQEATEARVIESQGKDYEPKGKHMMFAPPGWR